MLNMFVKWYIWKLLSELWQKGLQAILSVYLTANTLKALIQRGFRLNRLTILPRIVIQLTTCSPSLHSD